jgi:hypothetical protein
VENLDLCRAFYRDILGLGAPVMDSSFLVEFKLDAHSSLFLEKSEVLNAATASSSRISWIYKTEDPDSLLDILASYGYIPNRIPTDRVGFSVYHLRDPEGNSFYISPKEEQTI